MSSRENSWYANNGDGRATIVIIIIQLYGCRHRFNLELQPVVMALLSVLDQLKLSHCLSLCSRSLCSYYRFALLSLNSYTLLSSLFFSENNLFRFSILGGGFMFHLFYSVCRAQQLFRVSLRFVGFMENSFKRMLFATKSWFDTGKLRIPDFAGKKNIRLNT